LNKKDAANDYSLQVHLFNECPGLYNIIGYQLFPYQKGFGIIPYYPVLPNGSKLFCFLITVPDNHAMLTSVDPKLLQEMQDVVKELKPLCRLPCINLVAMASWFGKHGSTSLIHLKVW